MNKKRIDIVFGYGWRIKKGTNDTGLNTNAYNIAKSLIKNLKESFDKNGQLINFRRLRGSSGGYFFDSIYKMIKEADIIIIDLSELNSNVLIELGIAWAIQKESNSSLRIFLIKDKTKKLKNMPSNLNGYFISEYDDNGRFNDQGSFRMSLESIIKQKMVEYSIAINGLEIDEITKIDIDQKS